MTTETRHTLTLPGPPVTVDLSAEEVCRYLLATGWKEDTSGFLRGVWRRFRNASGPVYVPALDGAADFGARLREAIELIGRAENRHPLDVASAIIARRPGAAEPALDLEAIALCSDDDLAAALAEANADQPRFRSSTGAALLRLDAEVRRLRAELARRTP